MEKEAQRYAQAEDAQPEAKPNLQERKPPAPPIFHWQPQKPGMARRRKPVG